MWTSETSLRYTLDSRQTLGEINTLLPIDLELSIPLMHAKYNQNGPYLMPDGCPCIFLVNLDTKIHTHTHAFPKIQMNG